MSDEEFAALTARFDALPLTKAARKWTLAWRKLEKIRRQFEKAQAAEIAALNEYLTLQKEPEQAAIRQKWLDAADARRAARQAPKA